MPHFSKIWIVFITLTLCACGLRVDHVPLGEPIIPPVDAKPMPITLSKLRYHVPTGEPTVANAPSDPLEWLFTCDRTYGIAQYGRRWIGRITKEMSKEIFHDTLESIGYDVTDDPRLVFDREENMMRATHSIGGRILDVKMNTCPQSSWIWNIPRGSSGEGHIEIEWTVFDVLTRTVVYKTTTKGYAELKSPNYEGVTLLFEELLAASMHNLGTDEHFYNLIFQGKAPPEPLRKSFITPLAENQPGIFDPFEEVTLPFAPLSKTPARNRLEDLRKNVVLIDPVGGLGSGYFISEDGHILTNAHVVGHAKRVRISTSKKRHKLVAEVLRVDHHRDIALLKLEEKPENLKITPFPIRTSIPRVGEPLYAIGAPSAQTDTVTQGIFSRYVYRKFEKQYYLQSDVTTQRGSSGGPLLDENGNLVGMSVSAIGDPSQGLNFFIPIKDGLNKINVDLLDKNGRSLVFESDLEDQAVEVDNIAPINMPSPDFPATETAAPEDADALPDRYSPND